MTRKSTEKVRMGEGRRNGQASAVLALWFDGRGAETAAANCNSGEELLHSSDANWQGDRGEFERKPGEEEGVVSRAVGAMGGEGIVGNMGGFDAEGRGGSREEGGRLEVEEETDPWGPPVIGGRK
jgi:hypothetical protein